MKILDDDGEELFNDGDDPSVSFWQVVVIFALLFLFVRSCG
jgi:hypothetical protein